MQIEPVQNGGSSALGSSEVQALLTFLIIYKNKVILCIFIDFVYT